MTRRRVVKARGNMEKLKKKEKGRGERETDKTVSLSCQDSGLDRS